MLRIPWLRVFAGMTRYYDSQIRFDRLAKFCIRQNTATPPFLPPKHPTMKIVSSILLVIAISGLIGWLSNQPQYVGPDVPQGKLNSLSFAPYWNGENPFDKLYPTPAQIATDIQLMADKTHTIRTYASAEGNMPVIPELARKHHVDMLQGAWLGSIEASNQLEAEALIRSANSYPDVVKRVIVGNEVLLRRDLSPQQLIHYIRMVKAQIHQPVSYADVWSMYVQHPELIKEVDFVTIHILPYWEDEPVAVDQAPAHIERIYQNMRKLVDTIAPGKAILIGESGWPSQGRQRGSSLPSVVNEAKYIRSLIKVAANNGFDVNIVEATNQGWKSELEGVVGANWGLFSADRQAVFPLTGDVQENRQWLWQWLAASLLLSATLATRWQPLKQLPARPALVMVAFLQILTSLWVYSACQLWQTSYTLAQQLLTLLLLAANAAFASLAWQHVSNQLSKPDHGPDKNCQQLHNIYLGFALFALYRSLMLAINGRYLSFPAPQEAVMIAATVGLMVASRLKNNHTANWLALSALVGQPAINHHPYRLYGGLLLTAGIALIIGESYGFMVGTDLVAAYPNVAGRLAQSLLFTVSNGQLLAWWLCLIVLSIPLLNNIRHPPTN